MDVGSARIYADENPKILEVDGLKFYDGLARRNRSDGRSEHRHDGSPGMADDNGGATTSAASSLRWKCAWCWFAVLLPILICVMEFIVPEFR